MSINSINTPYSDAATAEAKASLNPAIEAELVAQGFPGYMCYSFLQTAKITDSIILSRLPGGVGTDLIDQGYDLKGFHIKAKSCNWGPMAGFICQLPVFNKLGINRVSYNTNEIGHYLKHLDSFSTAKHEINLENATRKDWIDLIDPSLPEPEQIAKRNEINKEFDERILEILKAKQKIERETGDWTGENGIREGERPFIPLKRKFTTAADLIENGRGIKYAVDIILNQLIYGAAENVTDENGGENKPSVVTEFLLHNEGNGLWQIYHGRIKYKDTADASTTFPKSFPGEIVATKVDEKVRTKYKDQLAEIFNFDMSNPYSINEPAELAQICSPGDHSLFPVLEESATFYKIRGFINPYPPFNDEQNYYKNAVSGDFDLFAIWPSMNVKQEELIRQSELITGRYNRIGGKIFTTYFGNKVNFGVEFIPGFTELNPNKDIPVLKESAEFGNMNSLCHLVSGFLNNIAATFISDFNPGTVSTANKGFHSDEGGRPGIMEVEFPIAVFMPQKMTTRVLNNLNREGLIPVPSLRDPITTFGGLIKSPEELVEFMLECMGLNYRVFAHYRWLIHLLYLTIDLADYQDELIRIFEKYKDEITQLIPDFKPAVTANFKDFVDINTNRVIIDSKMAFDIEAYKANIRKLLTYPDDISEFMELLKEKMIVYSVLGDKLSSDKKAEIEAMMNKFKINKQKA